MKTIDETCCHVYIYVKCLYDNMTINNWWGMLDKIDQRIFFKPEYYLGNERDGYVLTRSLLDLGLTTVHSRGVYKNTEGKICNSILYHPFETLPTSFTGMAFKIYHEGMKVGKGDDSRYYPPYIELKCSPAKILQGHNVFGSDNIFHGAMEMLGWLYMSNPKLTEMLDLDNAVVLCLDVTYSARLANDDQVNKVLDFMRNVTSKHIRKSTKVRCFENTVYWGSERCKRLARKLYGKNVEFHKQLKEQILLANKNDKNAMRVVQVMQDSRLQEWTKGVIRLETGMKAYWLDEQGLPLKLFDLIDYQDKNPNFLQDLWLKANAEIFKTLEGEFMNVTNDEDVFNLLANTYQVYTKSGKLSLTRPRNLKRFYDDIRQYGCDALKKRYSKAQYSRYMADLIDAGIPKAVLQNLHDQKDNNVIRFVELLKIDFGKQVPDWYEEPVSTFDFRPQPKLRLVS